MANHPSALKRARQNARRRARNRAGRTRLRTRVKQLRGVVEKGNLEDARALLPDTFSLIDRSVKQGLLKENAGARHKSRLALLLNRASGA